MPSPYPSLLPLRATNLGLMTRISIIRILLGVLILGGLSFPTPVLAVELVEGPTVEVTETSAVIRWTTDTPAGGRVQYGNTAQRLDLRAPSVAGVGTEHRVELKQLKPASEYWYSVGTARVPLTTNRFTTSGGVPSPPGLRPKPADLLPGTPALAPPASRPTNGSGNGRVRTPPAEVTPPPTKATWGSLRTLQDHFDRHGGDFRAKDPDDYAAQAWKFLRRAKAGELRAKLDESGVLRVYEPDTRAFAAYNRDGTTKTYFKPGRRDYFDDQPGTEATTRQLESFPLPR
jgi:hypothetical protein